MTIASVLFSEMTPDAAWENRFNAWYDDEHIPLRMGVSGFVGAQRYKASEGHGYLAVYDMEAPDVLASQAYRAVKDAPSETTAWMLKSVSGFTRYTGRLLSWQTQPGLADAALLAAPFVYCVQFTVPEERQSEFDDWYVRDHVPLLLGCPDWLGCRRYRILDGHPEPYTHLAIHHLSSAAALESPAREAARATPWRARLAGEPWFKGTYRVFSRHGARFEGRSKPAAI